MDADIRQGDLYWIDLGDPVGSEPGYRRPYVVVQNNVFNSSRIATIVVCALTTNLRRGGLPGNVLLNPGEGGVPNASVVNVIQLYTVNKSELTEKIGALSSLRIRKILAGIHLILEPREIDAGEGGEM